MPNGGLLSQFFRLSQQNEPVREAPLQDGQQLQANFQNLFYQNTRDWLVVDWRGSVYFAKVPHFALKVPKAAQLVAYSFCLSFTLIDK